MNGRELRQARQALSEAWGVGRWMTFGEFAEVLGLRGKRRAENLKAIEEGHDDVTGPIRLAVLAMLDGWRPPGLVIDHSSAGAWVGIESEEEAA